jgi:hypothetical protein
MRERIIEKKFTIRIESITSKVCQPGDGLPPCREELQRSDDAGFIF